MIDIEKVIKGLNYCKEREGSCISCPGNMECWCEEAIKLLELAEPVYKGKTPHCKVCGRLLYNGWISCPMCGQAVKWE